MGMSFFLKSLFPNIPYFLKFSKWLKILRKKKIYGVVRGQIEDKFICFQEKWLPQIPGKLWKNEHPTSSLGIWWAMSPRTTDPWWQCNVLEALSYTWRTSVDEKIREPLYNFHEGMRFHMKCPPWKTNPHNFPSPSFVPYPFCPHSPLFLIAAFVCFRVLYLNN